jgi:lipase chaperone LimK
VISKKPNRLPGFATLAVTATVVIALILAVTADDTNPPNLDAAEQAPTPGATIPADAAASSLQAPSNASEYAGDTPPNRHIGHLSQRNYARQSQYGELPASLRDTALLPLHYDAQGNFIVSENLIGLLKHFLLAAQYEGRDQALARMVEYIERVLPASAAEQALTVLDQYLLYEARVAEEIQVDPNEQDLHLLADRISQMVQQKKAIRREVMPPEVVAGLFATEEALDDFNVTTMRLNLDSSLSEQEKDLRAAQAEQLLPPMLREKKQRIREKNNLDRKIARLKTQQGSEEQIYQLRKDFYGKETADRITYYEDSSPEWLARVDQFNRDRATILQQPNLSQEARTQQIRILKQDMFSEQEQLKLAVHNIRQRAGSTD